MLRTIQSEDAVHCLTKVTAPVFMIRSVNCDKSQSSSQWVRGKYACLMAHAVKIKAYTCTLLALN